MLPSRSSMSSSPITLVFAHVGSVSVEETTYFGIGFILSAKPTSSVIDGQAAAKPSYVRRPSSIASAAINSSNLNLSPSSPRSKRNAHPPRPPSAPPGSSITPSSVTNSETTIVLIMRIRPPPTGQLIGMRLYPDIPVRRANAAVRDVLTLLALVMLAFVGLWVYHAVDSLTILGRGVHDAGAAVQNGFNSAADKVDGVPLAGGPIADGLRSAGEDSGGPVADAGTRGEERIHRVAILLGLLAFLLPAAALLSSVLPERIEQVRKLSTAERVLDTHGEDERRRLVAMRAAFALPYETLLAYTRDPLGDLAAGRYQPLIEAIAEDAGLRVSR